jgi:NAD(P)-dependent dehydrogenase (short-subunit alcohol dehydrogenase family)
VTRAVAVLRLLGRSRAPLGLKAIAEALDLVPSTGLHILRALVAEQLVRVDPLTRQYSLGVGMLPLARAVLENGDFPALVRPRLDELSGRYGVTAIGVALPDLDHMVVVALARAQTPVRLHVDVGSRFPALISATGRCLAAFGEHPWGEIERRFRRLRWHNAPSYEAWRKEVALARRQGFSIDRGNYIAGVTIVAVPVLNSRGTISHTIAAVGLGSQLDRASALALAREGNAVAIADLREEQAAAVANELTDAGARAVAVAMDVTDEEAVRVGMAHASDELGAVEVLVNCAGWDEFKPFLATEEAFWRRVIAINYEGCLRTTHAVVGEMARRRWGRIVNLSSDAARVGSAQEAVYAGAKAAVIAFTKTIAREFARAGVTANVVCPGPTQTDMLREMVADAPDSERLVGALERAVPMRRLGRPEEVAHAVAFLASEQAGYITGQTLSVSGGLTMA